MMNIFSKFFGDFLAAISGDAVFKMITEKVRAWDKTRAETGVTVRGSLARIFLQLLGKQKETCPTIKAIYDRSFIPPGLPLPSGAHINEDKLCELLERLEHKDKPAEKEAPNAGKGKKNKKTTPTQNKTPEKIGEFILFLEFLPVNNQINLGPMPVDTGDHMAYHAALKAYDELFVKKYIEQLRIIEMLNQNHIAQALSSVHASVKKYGQIFWQKLTKGVGETWEQVEPHFNALVDWAKELPDKAKELDKATAAAILGTPEQQAARQKKIDNLKKFH